MNSKKAITLLVLATLLLSMVPITFAELDTVDLDDDTGDYDDTIEVTGGEVPAGTLVELYWDDTTIAWNGVKGKMNETTADNDGDYEVWFDVPESVAGDHYVWIKAGGDAMSAEFTVVPRVDPDSSSGEALDKVDVDVYGQAGSKDIAIYFVDDPDSLTWDWTLVLTEDSEEGNGDDEVEGDLNEVVRPGTVIITDGVETFTDNGEGKLISSDLDDGDDGKINYVTGEWEVELVDPAAMDLTVTYEYLDDDEPGWIEGLETGETDSLGSWTKRVEIPDWAPNAPTESYWLATLDAKGNVGSDDFTIGAVITVSTDEVDVGDMITVEGRGFTYPGTIDQDDVTIGGLIAVIDDYDDDDMVIIDDDGEFDFKVFVPQIPDKEEDYDLVITDNAGKSAKVEIEVNAKAKITVTPDYGPQGSRVSISGVNFPNKKGEDIWVMIEGGANIEDFETDSDGSFDGTFRVPAIDDGDFHILAYWDDQVDDTLIDDTADFRVGSILVLLSDDEGPTGLKVILTGNGFTEEGDWNATFGDETIFEDEEANDNGLLGANEFYVPQVPVGTYDILVMDEDSEISVVVEFVVTDTTSFEIDPALAPAGYNITFEGMYWSEDDEDAFEFVVWNDTDDWDITDDVWKVSSHEFETDDDDAIGPIGAPWYTGDDDDSEADDGAFLAWWFIGDDDPEEAVEVFDMGMYNLNVTYGDDWSYTTTFEVGAPHSAITPRKSTFRIEDTLSFDVEHSFGNNPESTIANGVIEIYDPDGDLYWATDELDHDFWVKSGMYYYVPVSHQTANQNPMILLDDAPTGEWSYEWYEVNGDDVISEGTFMVEDSIANVVSGKIDDLNNQITGLQDSVSGISDDFDDVRSDIADVAAIAAQAVDAANTAADAIQTVAQTANTASQAAQNAADAANAAKDAASGLTTLVYGAIAAALVAALAAIVSLMQISRRIAG